jgi:putative ABC transport system permease protein
MFSRRTVPAGERLTRLSVDLRSALRGLRAGRGTTVLAFVILMLTMAAGTVTLSVVDAVALRPLPYASPDRLVSISLPSRTVGTVLPATPKHYFSWLDSATTFELLGAARFVAARRLEVDGVVETLATREVSANLFDVLGVHPAAGRFFDSAHERPGGPAGVILSHALWVRRFAADSGVIGREFMFGHEVRHVVGVLPQGVSYPITLGPPPDIYIPYIVTAAERSNDRATSMMVVGRLRSGVSVEQARADVQRLSSAVVQPLHDRVVGPAKTAMLLVLASVGFVLLVACANVAILFLIRATTRVRELATREALGASRSRLAIGLLVEGLILALASGAAGLVLSFWGVEIAKLNLPRGLTRVSTIAVDGRIVIASIAVAVLCGLVFASGPAWLAGRSDLVQLMKSGGGGLLGDRRRHRWLSVFLVADVGIVCILLVATTLVVTSFVLITTADIGFDRRNVMTLSYQRPLDRVAGAERPAAAAVLRREILDRVKSLPGVSHAAISDAPGPLSGVTTRHSIIIPGIGQTSYDEMPQKRAVTPDYFEVMGMQLLRGRLFEDSDRVGAPLVMLINDIAAHRFFAGRDPIGEVVTYLGPTTIIGVLKSVHFDGPEGEVRPELYTPLDQEPYENVGVVSEGGAVTGGSLIVRTTRDPQALASAVRDAVRLSLNAEPPQPEIVDDYFRRLTAGRRFNAMLMTTFGLIAVAIGVIGVYGTMAFVVTQQVSAIGLRMALGASPSRVMHSVLRTALGRVALGIASGLAGAWAASRALTSVVFEIRPTEPAVYIAVAGFLTVVGFAAALVPAKRAARLDPLTALRHE